MDFFKKFKWTPKNILKVAGLLFVAVLLLSIIFQLLSPIVRTVSQKSGGFNVSVPGSAPAAYDGDAGYGYGVSRDYAEESGYSTAGGESVQLSLNNIGIPIPPRPGAVGGDAEEFEVTEYSASIETRNRDKTCPEISALKAHDYVVFQSANEFDKGCNYTFKVLHERAEEILAFVENLDPKDLSENTYTIKRQLDDFTSEEEILKRKLESIDETLESAIDAYDDITALATRTQNAEALAKIIDSRINLIERLTQERIRVSAQLERLGRAKADQLDRLEYTYFHINVYENKFIDGENLKDSWKSAIKEFVRDINSIVQNVTIGLVALLFFAAQFVLYFLILLVVIKYLWRLTKYIWKR